MNKDDWNKRYAEGGNSGYGSYGDQAERKLNYLEKAIDTKVNSIVSIGCGDFHFDEMVFRYFQPEDYKGFDISQIIIKKNHKKYPYRKFYVCDDKTEFPQADLVMLIDVLFHYDTEDERKKVLAQAEKAWKTYLAITAIESQQDLSHFGTPLLKGWIEEEEGYLYIWKK